MTDNEILHNLHRRMDRQDEMLLEIRDKLTAHLSESDNIRPALDELVTLWKGSKIIIPILSAVAIGLAGAWAWAKAHMHL